MHVYPPVCPLSGGLHALVVGKCQHQQLHPHHRCGQRRQPHHGGAALRWCPLRLPVLCGGHTHPGTFPAGLLAAKDGANAPSGGAVCHRVGAQRLSQERRVRIAGTARPPTLSRHNTLRKKKRKIKSQSLLSDHPPCWWRVRWRDFFHETFLELRSKTAPHRPYSNSSHFPLTSRSRMGSSNVVLLCSTFSTLTHGWAPASTSHGVCANTCSYVATVKILAESVNNVLKNQFGIIELPGDHLVLFLVVILSPHLLKLQHWNILATTNLSILVRMSRYWLNLWMRVIQVIRKRLSVNEYFARFQREHG